MEGGKACVLRDLFQGALALAKSLPKACSDGSKITPPWRSTSVGSISHAVLSCRDSCPPPRPQPLQSNSTVKPSFVFLRETMCAVFYNFISNGPPTNFAPLASSLLLSLPPSTSQGHNAGVLTRSAQRLVMAWLCAYFEYQATPNRGFNSDMLVFTLVDFVDKMIQTDVLSQNFDNWTYVMITAAL